MKNEVFNAHNKYMIIKHAMKVKNVMQTCELFGISRTTYYKWLNAYQNSGMNGLEVKEPKKPIMPNKVSKSVEIEILDYVVRFPKDGPKRIYYELKSEGVKIGETGIYNVLKRNDLTTKNKRIEYAKKNIKSTQAYNSRLRKNPRLLNVSHTTFPGELVVQRVDYIGKFDKIGKIYQYTVLDLYSKWVAVKIFNRKSDIDIWDYFEVKLVYLMKTFNINIENLLTVKNKEFVPFFIGGERYSDIVKQFNFTHGYISSDQCVVLEEIDDFIAYSIKIFYSQIGADGGLDSFSKVDRALQKFVRNYNFIRPVERGKNQGKIPAQIVLECAKENHVDMDTLPLWMLALINPIKKEEKPENDKFEKGESEK